MQVNPINFTGNVTVLNGAKKYSNERDIKAIKQISDYEDVDFYIYSAKKSGKMNEYCAFSVLGDTANLRKFDFVNNVLVSSDTSEAKPALSIQNTLNPKNPKMLKIECDKEHGELVIGDKNSTSCILFSKHDLNFRHGGYLGKKFSGTLFDRNKNDELVEFNFEDGKLKAKKMFNKNGELIKEAEFAYDTKGSMTASLAGRLEDGGFNVLLPYNQSEAMFSLVSSQLMQNE